MLDSDGGLRFNQAPNYDLPTDANLDNVYEVTLRATAAGETTDLALRISVTNDVEGVRVTRVATGIVEPAGFARVLNEETLLVAEKGGRVLRFNTATNAITEDTFVRDNRRSGEVLAISHGFPGNIWQQGVYLVTHSAADGLTVQAFNAARGTKGFPTLGPTWSAPTTVSMINGGSIFIAVGSPAESDAQDASTPYGKLIELPFIDPYAGASFLPSDVVNIRPQIIGDGIRRPGGFAFGSAQLFLADRGGTREHEMTVFQTNWRPLDFGWPFCEGSQATRADAPAAVNGPTLVYPFGTGRRQGEGIVAGVLNDGTFLPALGDTYIFGDINGTIFSISQARLRDGFRHTINIFENKSEDFVPDSGRIDGPVGFALGTGSDHFFILDRDGEIFRMSQRPS
ncbi:hypothetical protein ACLBKU_06865 [Erythrobacter sp. NE805]|uniref:hypothetical protein n=1 Tax=Erythrobacter sp. NE805 TaxID=3389875 RepID=UPI00396B0AA5